MYNVSNAAPGGKANVQIFGASCTVEVAVSQDSDINCSISRPKMLILNLS